MHIHMHAHSSYLPAFVSSQMHSWGKRDEIWVGTESGEKKDKEKGEDGRLISYIFPLTGFECL